MDVQQPQGEEERAEEHLREFFKAMNQWEADSYARHLKDAGRSLPPELAAAARPRTPDDLQRIYVVILNRFCTRKPRGAGAGFRMPPTFDKPEKMQILEVRAPVPGRLELLTSEWNGRKWKFVLQKAGPLWLLDGAWWLDAMREQWSAQPL
jgi:hypothetical protein